MTPNVWIKLAVGAAIIATSVAMPSPASAYLVRNANDGACAFDGSACNVFCQNPDNTRGPLAGTMYWNGSAWSDGVRSDPNGYVVASAIVRAQGTYCH